MRISRLAMFGIINGSIAFCFVIYFGQWIFSNTTRATVTSPYGVTTISVKYRVGKHEYTGSYMRNGIPFSRRAITIRYLRARPAVSRVNSFMGMWAEPIAWWGVVLAATAVLLLVDNVVFSKSTIFVVQKRFPWIHMEEYFPVPLSDDAAPDTDQRSYAPKKKPKGLPGDNM